MIHKGFQCEFYFIRHGESESNARPGFVAGVNFDAPLTPRGVEQARKLGQRFKGEGTVFDRVYSSTLTRAVRTAETMLDSMGQPGRPFEKVEALIEQQMPGWRGVSVEEAFTPETIAYMRTKGVHFVPPEGESQRVVQRRVSSWLEDELIYNEDLIRSHRSLRVAVVGHGAATKCLFHYIMGFNDGLITRVAMENCSVSRFAFSQEGWSILSLNDTAHLDGPDLVGGTGPQV